MSEDQGSLASLNGSTDSLDVGFDPKPEDVELVNQIVRRAEEQNFDNDRDRLDAAYIAVFDEHSLDVKRDNACALLLGEILRPGLAGVTLYEKFENVMQKRGIELVPDDESTKENAPPNGDAFNQHQHLARSRVARTTSQPETSANSIRTTEDAANQMARWTELDRSLDEPPASFPQHMHVARLQDKRTLFRQFLTQCRDQLPVRNVQLMEHDADTICNRRLAFKVLSHWCNVRRELVDQTIRAENFHRLHQQTRSVGQLLDSARVVRMRAMEEERLKGMGLYKMTIASREAALRQALDARLKYKSLLHLANLSRSSRSRNQDLEALMIEAQQRSNVKITRSALAIMVSNMDQVHDKNARADAYRDLTDKSRLLRKWYTRTEQIVHKKADTEQQRAHFLMEKYLTRLREQQFRRKALCRWVFSRWRQHMRLKEEERFAQKKEELELIRRKYRREYKMRLASRCLRDVRRVAGEHAQHQQKAEDHFTTRSNMVAHGIVIKWYHRSHLWKQKYADAGENADRLTSKHAFEALRQQQQHIISLDIRAQGFNELHVQSASARCLRKLSRKIFELRRRQQDADEHRDDRSRQIARSCFDNWQRRAAEKRGEGPLVLPPATPAQRRADQLIQLASTTPLVAPRTLFVARLRGEPRSISESREEDDDGH